MQLFSWLHKRMTGRPNMRRPLAVKPRTSFRPRLEVLEGREVPSTLKVTNLLDGSPNNLIKGSLRYEIAAAQSGDTITFSNSLRRGTISLSSGQELFINKNLTIQGLGADQLTVTSGPFLDTTRIFEVGYAITVTMSGVTISGGAGHASNLTTNGYNDGYGGAILNHGRLTLSGCTLARNNALYGGAVYNDALGALTVSGCTVTGNASPDGGGGIYNNGVLTVSGSTLSNNSCWGGGSGGAIYNGGTATVTGCTVSGNSVYGFARGGGIFNGGMLTVSNSSFSLNTPDNIYGSYTDGGGNTFA